MLACSRADILRWFWCLGKRDFVGWRDFVLPSFIPDCCYFLLYFRGRCSFRKRVQQWLEAISASVSQLLRGWFKLEQSPEVLLETLYPAASVSGTQNASTTLPSLTLPLCQGQIWWHCTNTCSPCAALWRPKWVSVLWNAYLIFLGVLQEQHLVLQNLDLNIPEASFAVWLVVEQSRVEIFQLQLNCLSLSS